MKAVKFDGLKKELIRIIPEGTLSRERFSTLVELMYCLLLFLCSHLRSGRLSEHQAVPGRTQDRRGV